MTSRPLDDKSFLLDSMSGFDFEEFVADLLSRLEYGKVERVLFTQDGGRDILIRSPSGLVVVECKHQPKTGIGRPIVQKLHSAVVTSKASKGVLVTTGHFTADAIEYARKLGDSGTQIEMVDKPILIDMASRAHMKLVSQGEALSVWTYDLPAEKESRRMIGAFVSSIAESSPRPAEALIQQHHRTLAYRPAYLVSYRVDATFETGVGVIHRERADASVIFNGNSGHLLRDDVVKFLETERQIPFAGPHAEFHGELPVFRVDATTLQQQARTQIKKLHTKPVPYHGKNNVKYVKVCEPGERDIYIDDIRQVYLPLARVDFSLISTPYVVDCVQSPTGRLLPLNHDVSKCRVCSRTITERALICDACGRVTHSGGFRLKSIHGFRCRNCKRTVCHIDGRWRRRYILWREVLCPACSDARRQQGIEMRVLPLIVQ